MYYTNVWESRWQELLFGGGSFSQGAYESSLHIYHIYLVCNVLDTYYLRAFCATSRPWDSVSSTAL